jgi:NTE family protein
MKTIQYLVFSGGGAAIYGHAGALLMLAKQKNFSLSQIKAVAGASVGTLAALLVSLDYPAERLVETIKTFDIRKMADGGKFPSRMHRLFNQYGMHKGNELYRFFLKILQEKTGRSDPENITFADLRNAGYKDLYIIATKVYKENDRPIAKEKVFSPETTPLTAVATAMLASCAAPGYFQRVRLKKREKGKYVLDKTGDMYEDGGIVNNYPIDIFDHPQFLDSAELKDMKKIINPHTLGFALLDHSDINDFQHPVTKTPIPDGQPISYGKSLINALTLQYQKNRLQQRHNRERTVQIDRLKVGLAAFTLNEIDKVALLESGIRAVNDYFVLDKQSAKQASNDRTFTKKLATGQLWATLLEEHIKNKIKPVIVEEVKTTLLLNGG